MLPTAIDFEASCLPRAGRSFPIEVGIADARGARAWLIRPAREWAGWGWTAEAERLHGITRERLADEGLPAARVLHELADAVAGRELVADSGLDAGWLDTLARAGGGAMLPPVAHVGTVMDALGGGDAAIRAAIAVADGLALRRHRAAADARWLFAFVEALHAAAAARAATPLFAWGRADAAREAVPIAR